MIRGNSVDADPWSRADRKNRFAIAQIQIFQLFLLLSFFFIKLFKNKKFLSLKKNSAYFDFSNFFSYLEGIWKKKPNVPFRTKNSKKKKKIKEEEEKERFNFFSFRSCLELE